MNTPQDFTKIMQDAMGAFSVDTKAFEEAFKASAVFSEKLSKVALQAAEKSNAISSKWAAETLKKLGAVSTANADPADYSKAMTGFSSASAELATENLAALAEVAKKAQMETVELLTAAGKDLSEDATAAAKKATADVSKAAKVASK